MTIANLLKELGYSETDRDADGIVYWRSQNSEAVISIVDGIWGKAMMAQRSGAALIALRIYNGSSK